MSTVDWFGFGVVVLALGLWGAWVRASRLDRLHRKVTSSLAVVDAQLVRRATVAAELATSGLLDPVSSVVVGESAWAALHAETSGADEPAPLAELLGAPILEPSRPVDRSSAQSELTATLSQVLDSPAEVEQLTADPLGAELLAALAAAWYRVQLARRFHNESVAQARRVRQSWPVRVLHLAGRAPMPQTLELDDSWPATMEAFGHR